VNNLNLRLERQVRYPEWKRKTWRKEVKPEIGGGGEDRLEPAVFEGSGETKVAAINPTSLATAPFERMKKKKKP